MKKNKGKIISIILIIIASIAVIIGVAMTKLQNNKSDENQTMNALINEKVVTYGVITQDAILYRDYNTKEVILTIPAAEEVNFTTDGEFYADDGTAYYSIMLKFDGRDQFIGYVNKEYVQVIEAVESMAEDQSEDEETPTESTTEETTDESIDNSTDNAVDNSDTNDTSENSSENVAIPEDKNESPTLKSMTLSKTSLMMNVGETQTLAYTTEPANYDGKITWSSSDIKIASISDDGTITAISPGTITITAKDNKGIESNCRVTVKGIDVTSIKLESYSKTMTVDDEYIIKPTILPKNATDKSYKISSSDNKIVSVTNNVLKAKKAGTATITIKSNSGNKKTTMKITVKNKNIDLKSLKINKSNETLYLKGNKTVNLTVTYDPSNATNKNIVWSSSKSEVATVSSKGVVTAKKVGKTIITATSKENPNIKVSATIEVKEAGNCEITELTSSKSIVSYKIKCHNGAKILDTQYSANNGAKFTSRKSGWGSYTKTTGDIDFLDSLIGKKITLRVYYNDKKTYVDGNIILGEKTSIEAKNIKINNVKLNKTSLKLEPNKTETLKATYEPTNAYNKKILWKSSNPSVVTVDENGKITTIKEGTATVTAYSEANPKAKAECKVTVANIKSTAIILDKESTKIFVGENITLKPTIIPINTTNKEIEWKSSNTSIATVNKDGKITALKPGIVTITATAKDSKVKASSIIQIVQLSVSKINFKESNIEVNIGETKTVEASYNPKNANNRNINWSVEDNKLATVDPTGKVTANEKRTGTTKVIATSKDGKVSEKITVKIIDEKIRKLNLDKKTTNINTGKSANLKVTTEPIKTKNDSVVWKSSNTDIATVDQNGKVTAKKAGTTTISATSKANNKISDTVKISIADIKVTKLSLNKSSITLDAGKSDTLKSTIAPSDATNKGVTYKSSNTGVATVDQNGKVTAKDGGTATITAISKDGSKTATAKVTVKDSGSCTMQSITAKNTTVSYSVKCTGTSSISDTQYKVGSGKFTSRGNGWGSVKTTSGTISFKSSTAQQNVTVRIYYNGNSKYSEKTTKLGNPECKSGYTYDTSIKKCGKYENLSTKCKNGNYNSSSKKCEYNKTTYSCPNGGKISTAPLATSSCECQKKSSICNKKLYTTGNKTVYGYNATKNSSKVTENPTYYCKNGDKTKDGKKCYLTYAP